MRKSKRLLCVLVSLFFMFFVIQRRIHSEQCPKLFSALVGGNLGNQIFEYMSIYAYAKLFENADILPYCPAELRNTLEKVFDKLTIPEPYRTVPIKCYDVNNSLIVPIAKRMTSRELKDTRKPILLDKYSSKVDEIVQIGMTEIKKGMRIKDEHVQQCTALFRRIRASYGWSNEEVIFIALHYRGTDYKTLLDDFYGTYRSPPDYKYYNAAMSYFLKWYRKVVFILLTIDYEWLGKNLSFMENKPLIVVNPNGDDPIKDWVLLAHCNNSILSYGTFGATAALFNGGVTFVYDLNIAIDYHGSTVSMVLTRLLSNWILSY